MRNAVYDICYTGILVERRINTRARRRWEPPETHYVLSVCACVYYMFTGLLVLC